MGRARNAGKRSWFVAAVSLAVVAAGSSWTLGTNGAGASAPSAATNIVSATRTTSFTMPTPGLHKVQAITLGAGTWTIIAKATPVNFGSEADFFRCQLLEVKPKTVLDGATTWVVASSLVDVVTNIATLKVATTATVQQICGHDGANGDGGSLDPGSTLVAFRSKATRVRIARSNAQIALSPSLLGVLNITLGTGSWIIGAKTTGVSASASNADAECGINDVGFDRVVGSASGFHAASTVFMLFPPRALSAPQTFTLSCVSGGGSAYLDPGTVLWAYKPSDVESEPGAACPQQLTATEANDAVFLDAHCDVAAGSYPSQMNSVTLPAGNWLAIGAVAVFSGGSDIARCQLLNDRRGTQLDASSTDASLQSGQITTLAALTVKGTATIEYRCGHDQATSSDDFVSVGSTFYVRP